MNDLWKYQGQFVWISGSRYVYDKGNYNTLRMASSNTRTTTSSSTPPARYGAMCWIDPQTDHLWMYGGYIAKGNLLY